MGWYGTRVYNATPEDVRRIIRADIGPGFVDMSHGFGETWVLWQSPQTGITVPMCVLWRKREDEVVTKVMDLTMGPFYHRCPMRFLEACSPEVTAHPGARDWFSVWAKGRPKTRRLAVLAERFGVAQ